MVENLSSASQAVIFDLDGTLIDSINDLSSSVNHMLKKFNYPVHNNNFFKAKIGYGLENLVVTSLPEKSHDETIKLAVKITRAHYQKNLISTTVSFPAIDWLLINLQKAHIPISILSNKPNKETKIIAKSIFPNIKFSCVLGLQSNIKAKPDPSGVILIANELRLKSNQFVFVGDGETDMKAARLSRAYPIGVSWGYRSPKQLVQAGAALILNHPREIYSKLMNCLRVK